MRTYRSKVGVVFCALALAALALASAVAAVPEASPEDATEDRPVRPRLLVLTDIGGDPDDMQSMRRLLLYSNEFRLVGLIASSKGGPEARTHPEARPELIEEIVADYAKVRNNLARHAEGYPSAGALRGLIKRGSVQRGVQHLGEGKATPGSDHIIAAVDAAGEEPVYVAIWGGAHDLAQALYDVRASRSPADAAAFLSKLRVYAIGDQDIKFAGSPGTGQWIREHFPALRYIESGGPNSNRYTAVFRGMYQNDARRGEEVIPIVTDAVARMNQAVWVEAHVRRGHGALGSGYPIVKQNPRAPRNTEGVKEGDTPSWFYVLPNGLSDPEYPTYGGWGGRFVHDTGGHYMDAEDDHPASGDAGVRRRWTVARWREAYQNDFAARMDWSVAPYREANHHPVVRLGDASRRVVRWEPAPGAVLSLSAAGTSDPDGDALSYRWWVYREAGTYEGKVTVEGATSARAKLHVPADAGGTSLHVILEVTDDGWPALTSYRRLVLDVREQGRASEPAGGGEIRHRR